MSAIEALKLSGPIAVKTAAGASKAKAEGTIEVGAFSKLLSSVSNEDSVEQEQETSPLIADLEAAIAELQQLPKQELQPEQQELLAVLAQLLSLHQMQGAGTVEGKPSGYAKMIPPETPPSGPSSNGTVADALTQEKLVGLMHQIAQKVQELGQGTAKEFANVPIFMRVEKEYILNKPNKVNEVINLLMEAVENLETVQKQDGTAVSSKLADKVQELLQLFSGTVEEVEMPAEQQRKYELPPLAQKTNLQPAPATATALAAPPETVEAAPAITVPLETAKAVQASARPESAASANIDAQAAPERIEAAPASTVPLETAKAVQAPARPEPPAAPAPVVRMATLADDLGQILGASAKLSGTGETAQLKVSIFPEHLGQLEIRLSTVDGKVAAQIFTSNPMAKEALELQVYQLRNSLIQQGIQVDRIEISTQQQAGQSLSQQQGQQEQRFARQHRQQPTTKNGYQQNGEEAPGFVRGVSSNGSVMTVDYTI